jgi:hypothetical protein
MRNIIIILFILSFFGCSQKNEQKPISFDPLSYNNDNKLDSRQNWELSRLADPRTGKIPQNMRKRELAFAQTLPSDYENTGFRSSATWVKRGPWNVGGRSRTIVMDVNDPDILMTGGVSGGLWRTEDAGQSWTKITKPEDIHSVTCIVQDKRAGRNNIWYYSTGEVRGNSASGPGAFFTGNGVYKSTDNGLTWTNLASTNSGNVRYDNLWDATWRLALDPSVDTQDVVYAATLGAIYKSVDGGNSWEAVLGGNISNYAFYTDILVTPEGVKYATLSNEGKDAGIWRSEDGKNWTNILPAGFPDDYNRIVMDCNPQNENSIYFLANTTETGKLGLGYKGREDYNVLWKYTYKSGDGSGDMGAWSDLTQNIPAFAKMGFDDFQTQGSYDMLVKVKPDDSNVIFIGGTNIYRSLDGFTTLNKIKQLGGYGVGTQRPKWEVYKDHHPDQHDIIFHPNNPDVLINANDGGIYRTDDCLAETVVWTPLNNGYLTTQLYTINFDRTSTNDMLIAGFQDNGNYFVNNGGTKSPWIMPMNGDGSFSAVAPGEEYFIFSTQLGKMAKIKLDEEGNRIAFNRIDPIGGTDYQFINPFVMDPNDKNILYVPEGTKLWRNDSVSHIPYEDGYDSISMGWFKYTDTVDMPNRTISCIAVSTDNPPHRVYYGTSISTIYRIDDANVGDPEHKRIYTPDLGIGGHMNCIAVDPRDADKFMIVYSNYSVYSIYYSDDGGDSYKKAAGNLEENPDGTGNGPSVRWASILPLKNGKTIYFAATSVGLFATDTLLGHNTTWTKVGANVIGNVVVEMVETRPLDGLVAVATHGNGIYTKKVESFDHLVGINDWKKDIVFEMEAYPNPCQDFINLEIHSEFNQRANISVYDFQGKLILKRENIEIINGENFINLDLREFSKGTYYVNIQSELINKSLVINKI